MTRLAIRSPKMLEKLRPLVGQIQRQLDKSPQRF
jgi:hypothetical protein